MLFCKIRSKCSEEIKPVGVKLNFIPTDIFALKKYLGAFLNLYATECFFKITVWKTLNQFVTANSLKYFSLFNRVYYFITYDFCCPISYVVHFAHPRHLVGGFQVLGNTL